MTNRPRCLLLLGGTSDIGKAIAAEYAQHGWNIMLVARDTASAERNAQDLRIRHSVAVRVHHFDLFSRDTYAALMDAFVDAPDTAISVFGMMGDQHRAEAESAHAREILVANFEGPAILLSAVAERMAKRGSGTIVGISSAAGDRGRAKNYFYGAAKAGLTAFLSGLRNRFALQGVHVLTVKPGFVRTKMTEGMSLPSRLTADPREVGRAVYRAAELRKADVIYVRPIWKLIMMMIRAIPERQFKRMKI